MSEIFNDPHIINCIILTLKVASIATFVSFIFGLLLSWAMMMFQFPGKRWLDALCSLPLVLPPTVIGYLLILVIGRRGLLGGWLESVGISLMFSWEGAVVAATVVVFPLTYRATRAAVESVDHTLEAAARTLGVGELRIFCLITLPLAWRSIAAGLSLAFARGMGEFGATLMVAGNLPDKTQTMALGIYAAFQAGNDAKALALVALTAILCASLLMLAEMATSRPLRGRRAPVGGG